MRPVIALLAAALLVAVPLAGCTGGPSDAAVDPASSGNDTVSEETKTDLAGVDAPEWQALDWFEYEMSGAFTRAGSLDDSVTYKVIVHAPTEEGYETGTDSEAQLRYDLFWGADPLIGQMDHDLNPQDPQMPQLFNWPLEHNKTWETEGFGETFTFVAHARDSVQTHAGPMPGYHIVGEGQDSGWRLLLTYVPQMRWFSNWMVHNATDTMVINVDMTDMGRDYSGEMFVGSSAQKVESLYFDPTDSADLPFTVEDKATDLRFFLSMGSGGVSHARLLDPEGNEAWSAGPSVQGWVEETVHIDDPAAGEWRFQIAFTNTPPPGPRLGAAYLRAATFQINSMTH